MINKISSFYFSVFILISTLDNKNEEMRTLFSNFVGNIDTAKLRIDVVLSTMK